MKVLREENRGADSPVLYIYYFLLFCFVGWVYEVALAFLYGFGFVNRGFLYGPYLPLYGFGALILIFSLQGVLRRKVHIGRLPITPIVVFLLVVLITTVVEYLASWLMELAFDARWWDYSGYRYNLHGRISLSASLRFGFGGTAFLYILLPFFRWLVLKIPRKPRNIIAVLIVIVFVIDFALTFSLAPEGGFNPDTNAPMCTFFKGVFS